MRISVCHYSPERLEEREGVEIEEALAFSDRAGVTWIDVVGLHDLGVIQRIGEHFGLHTLALEDLLNTGQRPKLEEYGDHFFVVMKLLHLDQALQEEQLGFFCGPHWVVTFQEIPGDVFGLVRERLRRGRRRRIRNDGSDYLLYALIDALVDHGFPVLERIGEALEALEEEFFEAPTRQSLEAIHHVKREILLMRRTVWPQREVISAMQREESDLVRAETRTYLRDCYDHTLQIMDVLETYRDLARSLTDLYLSSSSHRTNEIMKVLTVISSIFIPLSFLAGVYGMNFSSEAGPWSMPELTWAWGYPAFWGLTVGLSLGMILLFRRKGWL